MRLLQNLSDTEVIAHLNNGQEKAFEVLFFRYHKDIHNVIAHYVKERPVTEDLCQDTFIRIYTSLKSGRYNEQGMFKPWALRIARNLCMDYLRKASQVSFSGKAPHDELLFTPTDQFVDNHMAAKQDEDRLNAFINRLPEDQRKVVSYRYFEELSFKEISALMNTSVNTSLGRMRYGLMNLRKQVNLQPHLWRP